MKMINQTGLALLSMSLLFTACNGSSSGGGGNSSSEVQGQMQNEVIEVDGSNVQGIYAAELWPVNYNLHFKKVGAVALSRVDDEFRAQVKMDYASRSTKLTIAHYTGRRCPNINDDLNKDAYIDIQEAKLAIGMITIPFDNDLDSQSAGSYEAFMSDTEGKFSYDQTASFDRMFADLKSPDENPQDRVTKVETGITIPGRIVLVQGLANDIPLPDTMASYDGVGVHTTIPVACGVLWKVTDMPAELSPVTPAPSETETESQI